MSTVIVYCYLESEKTKENLQFFLRTGVFDDDRYSYVFLINNNLCSCVFPEYKNIRVIHREDNQNDLMTYNWYLQTISLDEFSNFYFINSSCIGPFMPPICQNNWIDSMNTFLIDYALIGPIIEIPPDNIGFSHLGIDNGANIPFIHTYMFGVNRFGFSIVRDILRQHASATKATVVITERLVTSAILINQGKVKSLLSKFTNVDLNMASEWNWRKHNGDNYRTCYEKPNNYFGIDINPFEIIFVKNIRNANEVRPSELSGISDCLSRQIQNYSDWLQG